MAKHKLDKYERSALENEIRAENMLRVLRENDAFLLIALNLSGRRGELEDEAARLIEKHGFLRARITSEKKGNERSE